MKTMEKPRMRLLTSPQMVLEAMSPKLLATFTSTPVSTGSKSRDSSKSFDICFSNMYVSESTCEIRRIILTLLLKLNPILWTLDNVHCFMVFHYGQILRTYKTTTTIPNPKTASLVIDWKCYHNQISTGYGLSIRCLQQGENEDEDE